MSVSDEDIHELSDVDLDDVLDTESIENLSQILLIRTLPLGVRPEPREARTLRVPVLD